MAGPDAIILLILDYHAAIGSKTPVSPLRVPLARRRGLVADFLATSKTSLQLSRDKLVTSWPARVITIDVKNIDLRIKTFKKHVFILK